MRFDEIKQRLDPACWDNKKIGNPKTKIKGGVRVNNCVPKESVTEGQEVDASVVIGKLYDIIDHAEDSIKNADFDRQVQYATTVRDRAVKALNMIKQGGNTPEAASAAFRYMQTGEQGVAGGSLNEFAEKPENGPGSDEYEDLLFHLAWEMWSEAGDSAQAERKLSLLGWKPEFGDDYTAIVLYKIGNDDDHRQYTIDEFEEYGEQGVAEDFNPEYDDEAGMAQGSLHTLQNAVAGLQDVIDSGDNLPEWCQEKISLAEDYLVTVWDYIQSEKAQGIDPEISEEFDMIERIIESIAAQNGVDAETVWTDLESLTEDELYAFAVTSQLNEDWSKVNKRDKTDGMSSKAVKAYRREHPGSKLKTAVTTKPSKLKKGSKASKRRKSYCSRSKGQMNMHNISCAKTPDKAICKARRRWNC